MRDVRIPQQFRLMTQVFWDVMLYRWVSHDILKALCSCKTLGNTNPLRQHHSPVALNPQPLDSLMCF